VSFSFESSDTTMTIAKDNSLRQSKSIGKVSWEGALLNKSQQPRLSTFSEVSQPKLHGEEQAESAPNTYALQLQKHQKHTANVSQAYRFENCTSKVT
jgi:hypothetical protein